MTKGSDSGGDGSPRHVVVERVVSLGGDVPQLTKTNYHDWSLEMQVHLEGMELWDAVESGKADRAKDRRALGIIMRGVPSEMRSGLAMKKNVKEAWAAVRTMRMGDDRVKEANAQQFLKEFENVAFNDGESVDDFVSRITRLVGNLRELGEKMEDSRVVKKILRVLPPRYNQIACSIEMLLDLNTMSIEELVGRLRSAESRCGGGEHVASGGERLLLTEEQWEARRRQRGKDRGRDGRRCGDDHGNGRGGGHGDDNDDASSRSSEASGRAGGRHRGRCFTCNKRGHIAKDCPQSRKDKALFVDADEESTLL